MLSFTATRPLYHQVTQFVAGSGQLPLADASCVFFTDKPQADQIHQLAQAAATAAVQIPPNWGFQPPPPVIGMTYGKQNGAGGLGANQYEDILEGGESVIYKEDNADPAAPRLFLLTGVVNILNPEAPNDPPAQVLTINQYAGQLITAYIQAPNAGYTKLVLQTTGSGAGTFIWSK